MTNITPSQRLALARAVYPNAEQLDEDIGYWDSVNCWNDFLPESNPEQLLGVLCWLIQADEGHDTYAPDFFAGYILSGGDDFEHNCTPASLSDAIVRAAVRVMEGE